METNPPSREIHEGARPGASNVAVLWCRSSLARVYETLVRNDSPRPVDLIFVMAGRMERKKYGLELYGSGLAPRLLLSIGRFEVSKMSHIDFDATDELIKLRDRTAPDERHFFCVVNPSGIQVEKVKLRQWNTYGEVLAFRRFLERDGARSVMVISTDVHLHRVAITFGKVFRDAAFEFLYCPVPRSYGFLQKGTWWTDLADFKFVAKEIVKVFGYHIILAMPNWAIQRLMRLKP